MSEYNDIWYQSHDGLKLYARDYPHASPKLTLLCLPGLTRNSADFAEFCHELNSDYRLVVADQRGRGKSQYDSMTSNYVLATYVRDMFTLIATLQLKNVVLVGTSLGGLMSIAMHASRPSEFRAVIINDIGPELSDKGLSRIKSYLGKTKPATSWQEAIESTRFLNADVYPHFTDTQWESFAKKLYGEDEQGVPRLLYDSSIAEPVDASPEDEVLLLTDMWHTFEQLGTRPCLALRGELSDLLSEQCFAEMQKRVPQLVAVEVKGVGHTPMLTESQAIESIKKFLSALIAK